MSQRNPFAGMGGQWAAIGSAGLDRAIAEAQEARLEEGDLFNSIFDLDVVEGEEVQEDAARGDEADGGEKQG